AQARSIRSISERAASLPQSFVSDAPFTATWLTGSSLPTATVKQIGDGLQDVWPWLKGQNGPDGMYIGSRAQALTQPDPMMRRINLLQIDSASDISTHQLTNPMPWQVPPTQPAPAAPTG